MTTRVTLCASDQILALQVWMLHQRDQNGADLRFSDRPSERSPGQDVPPSRGRGKVIIELFWKPTMSTGVTFCASDQILALQVWMLHQSGQNGGDLRFSDRPSERSPGQDVPPSR